MQSPRAVTIRRGGKLPGVSHAFKLMLSPSLGTRKLTTGFSLPWDRYADTIASPRIGYHNGDTLVLLNWRRLVIKSLVEHGNSWALVIDRPILELLKIRPEDPPRDHD